MISIASTVIEKNIYFADVYVFLVKLKLHRACNYLIEMHTQHFRPLMMFANVSGIQRKKSTPHMRILN